MMISKITVYLDDKIGTINPNIYGHQVESHISNWMDGVYVGLESSISNINGFRKDVIESLKKLHIPVVRWGGCFMGSYNWKDGVGPKEKRPRRLSCWGPGEETNKFGTDEFVELCRLIGAEPMICMNVTEPVRDSCAWIEYCNYVGKSYYSDLRKKNGHSDLYNIKYWEIGNEVWSCGGAMDPEQYTGVYKQYSWYIIEKIAQWCPVKLQLFACGADIEWNRSFLTALRKFDGMNPWTRLIDQLVLHRYFNIESKEKTFSEDVYYNLLNQISGFEDEIKLNVKLLDYYGKRSSEPKDIGIAITEWGIHFMGPLGSSFILPYGEQVPFLTALGAAVLYNIFNSYSYKIVMTNPWMMINGATNLTLAKDRRMIVTPLYHVCDMYQHHMGNEALRCRIESTIIKDEITRSPMGGPLVAGAPQKITLSKELRSLSISASINKEQNKVVLTLVNQNFNDDLETEIYLNGITKIKNGISKVLTADKMFDCNDFDNPERVSIRNGAAIVASGEKFIYNLQAHSITLIELKI